MNFGSTFPIFTARWSNLHRKIWAGLETVRPVWVQYLPVHLQLAGDYNALTRLYMDFTYLEARCEKQTVQDLQEGIAPRGPIGKVMSG